MTQAPETATVAPRQVLSVFDVVMIAVGIVIGAGIFKTPALVAQFTGSAATMMTAWIAGAVLSLIGALTYAELATSFPSLGGDYTFLTRAYGRNFSFFFGWARAMVISTGSIALLGFALGDYLSKVYAFEYSSALYAAGAVVVLTSLNILGLKRAAGFQSILTLCEIGGVLAVVVAGFLSTPSVATPAAETSGFGMFGTAMVFVLLTYGGWNDAAYVSAEVSGGRRAVLRSLVIAIAIISALYLLVIIAAVHGLGLSGLKASQTPGADLMESAFGSIGAQSISAIVAVSALTSMNGTMIIGARSNFAVGNDWPLFRFLSDWRGERNSPHVGYLVQAGISLLLIAFGAFQRDGFAAMVEFTAPVFWFFFMMSGVALFVLRKKEPNVERPFRVPFYPILPAIFVATCAYLFYSSVDYANSQDSGYISLTVMAAGVAVWLFARRVTSDKSD